MIEGLEDMDDMDDADGGKHLAHHLPSHTSGLMGKVKSGHEIKADSSDMQFGAMQYGFFSNAGGEDDALELGGIEDGVDAPPEEEFHGGALEVEWDDLTQGAGHPAYNTLQSSIQPLIPTRQGSETARNQVTADFDNLSIASELLSSRAPQAQSSQVLLRPDSFASDPMTTEPPRRHTTNSSSDWPPKRTLRTTSLNSSQDLASSQPLSMIGEGAHYSNFGPSHSFSHTPNFAATKNQVLPSRHSDIGSLAQDYQRSTSLSWQQNLLQNKPQQTPAPPQQPSSQRPLTLEEVEARMFSQPDPPPLAQSPRFSQNPSLLLRPRHSVGVSPQNQLGPLLGPPTLSRHSLTGDVDPSHSRPFGSQASGLARPNLNPGLYPRGVMGRPMQVPQRQPPPPPPNLLGAMPMLQGSPIATLAQLSHQRPPPQAPAFQGPQPHQFAVPGARPHPQQMLMRPSMLARVPAGRGVGPGAPAPFVNNLIPARRPPPPEDGSAQSFRWHGSKFMLPEEIDSILRIQWKSLHNGAPYQEDYYYQALLNKITQGANSRLFTPDALRDLAPAEKMEEEPLAYVRLEGLGKIPYADVKRPKPIMDLVAEPNKEETDNPKGNEEVRSSKPLEQEPLLAARIVIEDCMCLLLDIDDIDRVCNHIFRGRDDEQVASLRRRRTLLLEALASSLRLPHTNTLNNNATSEQEQETDAVLKRLVELEKGRKLLARVLRLLKASVAQQSKVPPAKGEKIPVQRILWATLRISSTLFSIISPHAHDHKNAAEQEAAQNMIDITTEIALALIDVIGSLESGQALVDCMAALVSGDFGSKSSEDPEPITSNLLPLLPSGEPLPIKRTWLGDVVRWMMMCAERKGVLSQHAAPTDPQLPVEQVQQQLNTSWAHQRDIFWTFFHRHLTALATVYSLAKQAGHRSAANYAREMVPRELVEGFLSHSTQEQQADLLSALSRIFQA